MRKEEASEAERKARARFGESRSAEKVFATAGPQRRSEREIESNLLKRRETGRENDEELLTHGLDGRWRVKTIPRRRRGIGWERGPSPGRSVGAGSG